MFKKYLILSSIFLASFAQEPKFSNKIIDLGLFDETTETSCFIGDAQIGFIECTQLPFSIYILHSFFVLPEYRNKGYGRELLSRACTRLAQQKPRAVLIQPGPFELTRDGRVDQISQPNERRERLLRLCALYQKAGFQRVSKPTSVVAGLVYKLIGLAEDSSYLMVQDKNAEHSFLVN